MNYNIFGNNFYFNDRDHKDEYDPDYDIDYDPYYDNDYYNNCYDYNEELFDDFF